MVMYLTAIRHSSTYVAYITVEDVFNLYYPTLWEMLSKGLKDTKKWKAYYGDVTAIRRPSSVAHITVESQDQKIVDIGKGR